MLDNVLFSSGFDRKLVCLLTLASRAMGPRMTVIQLGDFFSDPGKTASITDLKQELIERCGTILRSLSSGHEIEQDKFRTYCLETARLYVAEYSFKVNLEVRYFLSRSLLNGNYE